MNKQVTNLLNIPTICREILDILLREELIEAGDYKKLEHINLTAKGKTLIKAEMETGLSRLQVKEYLNLWPRDHQCSPSAVQRAYLDMLNSLDKEIKPPTFQELLQTVKLHLQHSEPPFCGDADYFLCKNKKSRCINRLIQLRNEGISIVKPVSFSTDV